SSDAEEQRRDIRDFLEHQTAGQPFVRNALAAANPPIESAAFVTALSTASEGNFKYIEYAFADIAQRQPGDPPLDLSALPHGLLGYYAQFWARMQLLRDSRGWSEWKELYLPAIALIAVAGEPVSADWLALLTGREAREIDETVLPKYRRFLESSVRGGVKSWSIVHKSFADYLRDEARVDLKAYHAIAAEQFRPAER